MRIESTLSLNLAPEEEPTPVDVTLEAGSYVFNRASTLGTTETFEATAILAPGTADAELLIAADIPFDYKFQRPRTLAAPTVLRLQLKSLDLAETRWSSVVVEYDKL